MSELIYVLLRIKRVHFEDKFSFCLKAASLVRKRTCGPDYIKVAGEYNFFFLFQKYFMFRELMVLHFAVVGTGIVIFKPHISEGGL